MRSGTVANPETSRTRSWHDSGRRGPAIPKGHDPVLSTEGRPAEKCRVLSVHVANCNVLSDQHTGARMCVKVAGHLDL